MPETYRVVRGVSCRLSKAKDSPEHEQFQRWEPGDVLDPSKAPEHLNVRYLVATGAIQPIPKEPKHGKE